jgi:poly-gamma-glutamate synthesis protein (capsule biosynthesis protein)
VTDGLLHRAVTALLLTLLLTTGSVAALAAAPGPSLLPDRATASALPSPALSEVGPDIPYVPVLRFWTQERGLTLAEIRAAIEGRHPRFRRVLVAGSEPAGLWDALGVSPATTTRAVPYRDVVHAVEGSRRVLGLVPAAAVTPQVRALSIDGRSLFGGERIRDLAEWPLRAPAAATPQEAADEQVDDPAVPFDPARTWTLIAGGDVMLDREVHRQAVIQGKGPDHPWSGGFARVASRTCCTVDGGNAITSRSVGPRGALRALISGADLAVVNHEGPAPNRARYHPHGLVFAFDPSLHEGLADVGIDLVSLANNHIRNAGSTGVVQTIRNLRRAGIGSVGAAADAIRARRPACLDVQGQRVCLLAYDAINTGVHAATPGRPGAARLQIDQVRDDIRHARAGGADVVIVMPHWGREYVTSVTAEQRRWARSMIRAGADAVLGAHSHVTGPIERIDGRPVLYSLGNLLFDLPRFEETEEGVLAELTFEGARLAQLELHPTVIVDRSRVMLLDPARDGRVVLRRMQSASSRLLR